MKYVRSTKETNVVYADTLEELIRKHSCIGFVAGKFRYMIVPCGSARKLAVNCNGTHSNTQTGYPMSQYRIFDTEEELYEWMKGKEDVNF